MDAPPYASRTFLFGIGVRPIWMDPHVAGALVILRVKDSRPWPRGLRPGTEGAGGNSSPRRRVAA
eukprot:15431045-Alexandrium_andersonii.AAC.1